MLISKCPPISKMMKYSNFSWNKDMKLDILKISILVE